MLITKTNPAGVDVAIQNLQIHLHKQLVKAWSLTGDTDPSYECYGRCHRNKIDSGYIAEVFTGGISGVDYKEVYWNDELKAISFFGTGSKTTFDKLNKADVHLVFFVNVSKLKPLITHRADEEVRSEIQQLFGNSLYGFSFESMELWLENVLKEYPGSRRDDRLIAVDMQPVHCFRINLTLLYKPSICNSLKLK
jgi:hypothetical protein